MTSRAVNPQQFGQQLKMFMSAREIVGTHNPHAGDKVIPNEPNENTWGRKYMEASESGHADAILAGGGAIEHPISLSPDVPIDRSDLTKWGPAVSGGQHRVAVMAMHKPDELLPVVHHPSIIHAQNLRGKDRPPGVFPYR